MRRLAIATVLLALTAAAAPARAQPANPCDHFLPTGEALPRQDVVRGMMPISEEPGRQGQRLGRVHSGDRVDVLKECGRQRLIRTADGVQGWIATSLLPHEEALNRQAMARPPKTDQDCELRYDLPQLADGCKTGLAQKKAREDELTNSVYLKGDQLRSFVSGKTLTVAGRPGPSGEASRQPVVTTYLDGDGEAFLEVGNVNTQRWRGRWYLKNDKLCFDVRSDCSDMRRIPSGEVISTAPGGEYIVTREDGDPKGLVAKVTAEFPYPRPPPVPAGIEAVAHPVMGW